MGRQASRQLISQATGLEDLCLSLLYDRRPLKKLLVAVQAGNGEALVSTAKKGGEGCLGWRPRNLLERAFQVDNCSLASGQLLARIWPFRVIMIG